MQQAPAVRPYCQTHSNTSTWSSVSGKHNHWGCCKQLHDITLQMHLFACFTQACSCLCSFAFNWRLLLVNSTFCIIFAATEKFQSCKHPWGCPPPHKCLIIQHRGSTACFTSFCAKHKALALVNATIPYRISFRTQQAIAKSEQASSWQHTKTLGLL